MFLSANLETYLPVIFCWNSGHQSKTLILHPLILSTLADFILEAVVGGSSADGTVRFPGDQAVEGTMDAARRGGRRGFRGGALSWSQGSGDVKGRLWRAQLTRLQGQLMQVVVWDAWRGRGVVGGSGRGGVDGRRVAVDGDLASWGTGGLGLGREVCCHTLVKTCLLMIGCVLKR